MADIVFCILLWFIGYADGQAARLAVNAFVRELLARQSQPVITLRGARFNQDYCLAID
jgi:hypothetical protein